MEFRRLFRPQLVCKDTSKVAVSVAAREGSCCLLWRTLGAGERRGCLQLGSLRSLGVASTTDGSSELHLEVLAHLDGQAITLVVQLPCWDGSGNNFDADSV